MNEKLVKKHCKKVFKKFSEHFSGSPLTDKHDDNQRMKARVHGNVKYFAPSRIDYQEIFTDKTVDNRIKLHGLMLEKMDTLQQKFGFYKAIVYYQSWQRESKFQIGKKGLVFTPMTTLLKIIPLNKDLDVCMTSDDKIIVLYEVINHEVSKNKEASEK